MKYRILGRTHFEVSDMAYGLWGMSGWTGSNDDESLKALQLSVDLGCNFFDTAWAYREGESDGLLGEILQREKLREDSIDVLQFHVWDDSWTDEPEFRETVEKLKTEKWIRSFGISINRWEPENGLKALRTGLVDVVQAIYNIFDQAPEDKLFPLCRELNVGVIARVPLDEGSLGGKMNAQTKFPPNDWRARYFGPENLPETIARVEELKKILPAGMTLPEMALRFILSNPDVSTTIVGMRKHDHVRQNLALSDAGPLDPALLQKLRSHGWTAKGNLGPTNKSGQKVKSTNGNRKGGV